MEVRAKRDAVSSMTGADLGRAQLACAVRTAEISMCIESEIGCMKGEMWRREKERE